MSTKAQAAGKPPVIRTPAGGAYGGIDLTRVLPAWIISAVMHVAIVLLFLALGLLDVNKSKGSTDNMTIRTEVAEVDDQENSADLTDSEMGKDPEVPLNYNVDRLADVSVPGIVVPTDPIGIAGAPRRPGHEHLAPARRRPRHRRRRRGRARGEPRL